MFNRLTFVWGGDGRSAMGRAFAYVAGVRLCGPKGRTELILSVFKAKNCQQNDGDVHFCAAPLKPTKKSKTPICVFATTSRPGSDFFVLLPPVDPEKTHFFCLLPPVDPEVNMYNIMYMYILYMYMNMYTFNRLTYTYYRQFRKIRKFRKFRKHRKI